MNNTKLDHMYHPAWLECYEYKAWEFVDSLTEQALLGDKLANEMLPWWIDHALSGACLPVPNFTPSERERMDNG